MLADFAAYIAATTGVKAPHKRTKSFTNVPMLLIIAATCSGLTFVDTPNITTAPPRKVATCRVTDMTWSDVGSFISASNECLCVLSGKLNAVAPALTIFPVSAHLLIHQDPLFRHPFY